EEESGGSSAVDHVAADPELDAAAAAVIFDGPMLGPRRPAFYVGLRGLAYFRVTVRAAERDGHSGLFGGAALNAAHALMRVLGAVTPDGGPRPALAVGTVPPTEEERAAWEMLPPGEEVLAGSGLVPADAVAARDFYLRTTALPSVDVHGIACGDPAVVATSIPAVATCTVSVRVAPGQSAEAVGAVLERLMRDAAPDGARVDIAALEAAEPALVDPAHPVVRRAADAVEAATGWRPAPVRIGGTLPVVTALAARGVPVILTGFYLPDDGVHSPNEGISLDHLAVGVRAAAAILEALGGT
ncbi:MAG: M20/M25/M40 family metallo-hydrolase, partial [Actinomycetota bacterium]